MSTWGRMELDPSLSAYTKKATPLIPQSLSVKNQLHRFLCLTQDKNQLQGNQRPSSYET